MAAPEVYSLAQCPITAHAFNQDRSRKCSPFFMNLRVAHHVVENAIRDCGQLELEGCTDILQGKDRLEGYGDLIRGSCHVVF